MPSAKPLHVLKSLTVSTLLIVVGGSAWGQTSSANNSELKLAADSPFHDPDIIYLEANELINDETNGVLTAIGEVEGRYQDKTLRADRVVYNIETGRVIATGKVSLIDANGSSQYAEKLELSNELEAGTATDFTARGADGGISGAKFATRRTDGGIDLFNAYYTACIPCQEGDKPTWRIRARRVSQDTERNMVVYKDAVFSFLGLPILYTPYLAHPDPTQDRASGFLTPYFGLSSSKGPNISAPYYVKLDDYSELTLTPRIFTKVNPVMEYQYRRKFYSGEININGSFTYASIFDRNGDPFSDTAVFSQPDHAPLGRRLRTHTFANGLFRMSEDWDWGFSIQGASDDLYIDRYDLPKPSNRGLYDSGRLTSKLFAIGQDDDFRVSLSTFGYQSLRTRITQSDNDPNFYSISREDDSVLPIAAPKIELNKYLKDPVVGGRVNLFGDLTALTRKEGTDYLRGTVGAEWNKTFIAPLGIEAKPFAMARYDYFDLEAEDEDGFDFNRTVGQVGIDVRWPFLRAGKNVDVILEPRVQLTQSFGDGKLDNFDFTTSNNQIVNLFQDSIGMDLEHGQFWASNKSYGYDFWQKGFRADVGGSATALWGENRAELFVGQSFASDITGDFATSSGLSGTKSDYVGRFELDLGRTVNLSARTRYDDSLDKFTRIDTSATLRSGRFDSNVRYYKIDNSARGLLNDPSSPDEEISARVGVQFAKNWKATAGLFHDFDSDLTRRKEFGLSYSDDCTKIDFIYTKRDFNGDIIRDTDGFSIRISLLTLGETRTD